MRIIIVLTKEKRDLHPLLIGLLETKGRFLIGSISEPKQRDGYFWLAIRDDESGVDMSYTYENGELKKEPYDPTRTGMDE